jgi:hypothetical protein
MWPLLIVLAEPKIEIGLQAPTFDERWNCWCDQRIDAKISAAFDVIADELGTLAGEDSRFMRSELEKLCSMPTARPYVPSFNPCTMLA